MIRKRVLLLVTIVPLILGYYIASHQSNSNTLQNSGTLSFDNMNVVGHDVITLSAQGNIYQLNQSTTKQITRDQTVIEPAPLNNGFIGIVKTTNYAQLLNFDQNGNLLQPFFNGNTGNINTMSWISDPAVNQANNKIAFVSDKDKQATGVPDNALYVLSLQTNTTELVAKPDPYSGGLTHPTWDPANAQLLFYDYYQYDPKSLNPYSTIEEFDPTIGYPQAVTTNTENAFQENISPNGKKIIFLLRTADTLQVSITIADLTENGLTHVTSLATGDFAYPEFSLTNNHIYFMEATGNSGYNLYTASILKNKLTNILPIAEGAQLLGNSSYTVTANN